MNDVELVRGWLECRSDKVKFAFERIVNDPNPNRRLKMWEWIVVLGIMVALLGLGAWLGIAVYRKLGF